MMLSSPQKLSICNREGTNNSIWQDSELQKIAISNSKDLKMILAAAGRQLNDGKIEKVKEQRKKNHFNLS